jgi:hypothetical protein
MSDGKNILETFRDVAQDILVPRLKALEVEMESLRVESKMTSEAIREEMRLTSSAIREEMKLNSQLLREEMKFRYEALEKTIAEGNERLAQLVRHGDEINEKSVQALSEKLDGSIPIRERLAAIEARLPRQ